MSLIERLFPGTTAEQFRSAYWLYETLHARAPLSRFPEIATKPVFASLPASLGMRCGNFRVDMPDQNGKNRVAQILRANAEQAQAALDRGDTVYFGALIEAPLPLFADQLSAELDLPVSLGRPFFERFWIAFAARPSKGLRWHWDKHHLFILQVLGKKRFLLARNQYFQRPTVPPVGYDGWRKGMDPWLKGALGVSRIEESELPSQYDEIELCAGDALFLPAGTWHSAETLEDSLHLAHAIKVPTLPELLIAQMNAMHDVSAARFHVPVASTADIRSLCGGDDSSNEPLQEARREWFSQMGRTMGKYSTGDHLATFLKGVVADLQLGAFSGAPKEPD